MLTPEHKKKNARWCYLMTPISLLNSLRLCSNICWPVFAPEDSSAKTVTQHHTAHYKPQTTPWYLHPRHHTWPTPQHSTNTPHHSTQHKPTTPHHHIKLHHSILSTSFVEPRMLLPRACNMWDSLTATVPPLSSHSQWKHKLVDKCSARVMEVWS